MNHKEWKALPFGEIRIEHGFPGVSTVAVLVDGTPVARLPVTKIGFDRSYADDLGHVTLTMTSGDCLILSSRPKLPMDESESS